MVSIMATNRTEIVRNRWDELGLPAYYAEVLNEHVPLAIGYWVNNLSNDGEQGMAITDLDDNKHRLMPSHIRIGIDTILGDQNFKIRDDLKDVIAESFGDRDCGCLGVDEVDCIVQAGLFGELVYG